MNATRSFFRSLLFTTLIVFLTSAASVKAEAATPSKGGPFGLGVILGDPSAITLKYMLDPNAAIDGGISFNFGRWFLVYGDWLYHVPGAFGARNEFTARLTPYLGIGGLIALSTRSDYDTRHDWYYSESSDSKLALGLRIPLGLEWKPATVPVGVFIELAPGLIVVPATHSFIQGGLGARFYF